MIGPNSLNLPSLGVCNPFLFLFLAFFNCNKERNCKDLQRWDCKEQANPLQVIKTQEKHTLGHSRVVSFWESKTETGTPKPETKRQNMSNWKEGCLQTPRGSFQLTHSCAPTRLAAALGWSKATKCLMRRRAVPCCRHTSKRHWLSCWRWPSPATYSILQRRSFSQLCVRVTWLQKLQDTTQSDNCHFGFLKHGRWHKKLG